MSRSLDVSECSAATVSQVFAAFGDRAYWTARLSRFKTGGTLDVFTVDSDHAVRVRITQDLVRDRLPGIMTKIYRRDLTIAHSEIWRSAGDGRLHGRIEVAVSGAPGSGRGTAIVAPAGSGSRLTLSATVNVDVPIIGGTIEALITREFATEIEEIQRFTREWISVHV